MGIVSTKAPLISNLNVGGNIALIPQYHRNLPARQAAGLAEALLGRLGMTSIMAKRSHSLTPQERFCAMLLRAAALPEAIVLIERPFSIMPDLPDGAFVLAAIDKIEDLIAGCHIFDYTWEQKRYQVAHHAED